MKTKKILLIMLCFCVFCLCFGCEKTEPKTEKKNSAANTVSQDAKETDAPAQKKLVQMETPKTSKAPEVSQTPEAEASETPKNDSDEQITETPAADSPTPEVPDLAPQIAASQIENYLEEMTLEQKIAQMFIISPEALTGSNMVTAAGEATEKAIHDTPVGGLVYMEQNLSTPSQVTEMLINVQTYSEDAINLPLFTCIDEEGGTVARLNKNGNFNLPPIGNMSDVGASGNADEAYQIGLEMGSYLSELGFNVDFAPVADVLSNPDNEVVKYRSFGEDPMLVADMSAAVLQGLREKDVLGTFKHFPGHGATEGDTHEGYAFTLKTLDDLKENELIPFQRGIEEGVDFIMVGHISLPSIIGDSTPASLSYRIITEILRGQMGYDGLVITDAMNMGAISETYSAGDAAIKSIKAGSDILLMPSDFKEAYNAVLQAVEGTSPSISMERIDDSVRRILEAKMALMEKTF